MKTNAVSHQSAAFGWRFWVILGSALAVAIVAVVIYASPHVAHLHESTDRMIELGDKEREQLQERMDKKLKEIDRITDPVQKKAALAAEFARALAEFERAQKEVEGFGRD